MSEVKLKSTTHDSAPLHVRGTATYCDDIALPANALHVYIAMSAHAHARIKSMDLSAVRAAPGVVCVLSASDIPGENDVSPAMHDDPMFAEKLVEYAGQSLFAVAAETIEQARRAAKLAKIDYKVLKPILTIDQAMKKGSFLSDPVHMSRGDPANALPKAAHRLTGRVRMGGQDHFYLEGHVAVALPGEGGAVSIQCSSQHPSEIQHIVASVLGLKSHDVGVQVRRMGGAFGGKETQGNLPAATAALVCQVSGRPAKVRYDRDDDMMITGKRHDFRIDYDVGFDDRGRIEAIVFDQALRCGMSHDVSGPIGDRAMFHADNCYYFPHVEITSHRCKTHTVSNTAFRGFGGPQGMVGIEQVIEDIAAHLGLDPLAVRRVNFYDAKGEDTGRGMTPYHMAVEDNVIAALVDDLARSSKYAKRRKEIAAFNAQSPILKKGLSLVPIKFGISFTLTFLNQAGALIHIYNDGSIHLNHGGTEMGQGLFTKVAQVVAHEFGVGLEVVKISATNTEKVPNTSATAASSGTDMNGMAARNACLILKDRLRVFGAREYGVEAEEIEFAKGKVRLGKKSVGFAAFVLAAYQARVSLSSTGFYATPKVKWDAATGRGRPFYYFAYGAAVSEVMIDTLTGENRIVQVDILEDVGHSLNPAIDLGQIEGGFVQGAGWLTTEELVWDDAGNLKTHAPSTYKIPTISDRAPVMNVNLWKKGRNEEETIYRSKAVGEPPLMLGISVLSALRDAVSSVAPSGETVVLDAPATPERILMEVERLRRAGG